MTSDRAAHAPEPRSEALGWTLVSIQFALLGTIGVDVVRARRLGGILGVVGIAAIAGGTTFIALASRLLGRRLRAHPAPHPEAVLRTDGVYGVVRHPIYLGLLLLATGGLLIARTRRALVAVAMLAALLHMKSDLEEEMLAERFPDYDLYAARVPKIVPLP